MYQVVDKFYEAFKGSNSERSIGEAAKWMKLDRLANELILYRFYYGDIQNYEITKIKKIGNQEFEVVIKVNTINVKMNKQVTYRDTMKLTGAGRDWTLEGYTTTSSKDWPKFP